MIERTFLFGLLGRFDDCMSSDAPFFSSPPRKVTLVHKKRISFHDDCVKHDKELGLKSMQSYEIFVC